MALGREMQPLSAIRQQIEACRLAIDKAADLILDGNDAPVVVRAENSTFTWPSPVEYAKSASACLHQMQWLAGLPECQDNPDYEWPDDLWEQRLSEYWEIHQ